MTDITVVTDGRSLFQKALELVKGLINVVNDPSRFSTAVVFKEGEEVLEGKEFIKRAQELDSMGRREFYFYSKSENWKYLPKDDDVIVFPRAVFYTLHGRSVGALYRQGSEWYPDHDLLTLVFNRLCRVAVNPSNSNPKVP